jgi:hypothetical protein
MIILGIRVSNINEVLTQFDVIRVYRDIAPDGGFTNPPIGTIQMVVGQMDYEYLDAEGNDTHWYAADYYHTTPPNVVSDKSIPFKGIPATGPLGILTPDYIRASTDFPALAAMSDTKLWSYIWRAEALIYSWAQQYGGFCTEDKLYWDVMARIGALMVVEQLYITGNPASRARAASGVKSEKIGSYSYTLSDSSYETTSAAAANPYAFGAEPLAIFSNYTCGTSSMIHMKTTQVFPELAPIPGYVLTPQYAGVEVRPWHDFTDLELKRGVLLPGTGVTIQGHDPT